MRFILYNCVAETPGHANMRWASDHSFSSFSSIFFSVFYTNTKIIDNSQIYCNRKHHCLNNSCTKNKITSGMMKLRLLLTHPRMEFSYLQSRLKIPSIAEIDLDTRKPTDICSVIPISRTKQNFEIQITKLNIP